MDQLDVSDADRLFSQCDSADANWEMLMQDETLDQLEVMSITSSLEDRMLQESIHAPYEPPSPEQEPLMELLQRDWNGDAPWARDEDYTAELGWFHGRVGPEDGIGLAERAFPPQRWVGSWNAISAQQVEAAIALRQEAERWEQRLLYGEKCTLAPPDLPRAGWNNRLTSVKPLVKNDRSGCLYTIVQRCHNQEAFCLQAVDPLVSIGGREHLRFLTLDQDSEDILALTRGVAIDHIALGDQVWVYGVMPSLRLMSAPSILEGLNNAKWMATVQSPPHGWHTAFRVREFSLVEPSEKTHTRLARVARDGMTVEGEDGKRKFPIPQQLVGKEGFFTIHFRRVGVACLFFSAPPKTTEAKQILLQEASNLPASRLQPGFDVMLVNPVPERIECLLEARTEHGLTQGYATRDNMWQSALRLISLGSAGIRVKHRARYDFKQRRATLEKVGEDGDSYVYRARFRGRAKEAGWGSGAKVKIDFACGAMTYARIQHSVMEGTTQLIRLVLTATEKVPEIGDPQIQVKMYLTEGAIHNPSQERMMHGVTINQGTRAEQVMMAAYDGMTPALETIEELPDPGDDGRRQGLGFAYDDDQWRFIHHSSSALPLIFLDAGAGCGKTSALAGAARNCLDIGDSSAVVVVAAATNTAVSVIAKKLLEVGGEHMRLMRFLAKAGEETTEADLQEWMLRLEHELGVPEGLRATISQLRKDLNEMKTLTSRCPDVAKLCNEDLPRYSALDKAIQDAKNKNAKAVLEIVRPNTIAITLDSLIAKLQSRDPLKEYIKGASEVTLFVDECSQASEGVMVTLAMLLPDAFHRYIGDPAQLPPHCLVNRRDFDKEWGARGIANVLTQARECPRVTLRMCRRMHPGLCRVPSHLFYRDTLIPAVTADERRAPFPVPDTNRPMMLVHVEGREKVAPSGSRYNDEETTVAGRLAHKIKQHTDSVLVLSYYKEQVARLKDAFPNIEASTIDSAQGQEKDVIILVLTKTFPFNSLHISDPLRTNVALTRARRVLYIVGHRPTLSKVDNWSRIVQYLHNKDLIREANDLLE